MSGRATQGVTGPGCVAHGAAARAYGRTPPSAVVGVDSINLVASGRSRFPLCRFSRLLKELGHIAFIVAPQLNCTSS
jgi:hypothetical protein